MKILIFALLFVPAVLFGQCSGKPSQFPDKPYELKQPVTRDVEEYFFYYSEKQENLNMQTLEPEYVPMWVRGEQVTLFSKKPISKEDCPDCIFVIFAPLTAIKYGY